MTRFNRRGLVLFGVLASISMLAGPPAPDAGDSARVVPVPFEENLGQVVGEAAFLARGSNVRIEVLPRSVSLVGAGPVTVPLRLEFLGADPGPPRPAVPLLGLVHYLIGTDLAGWQRNVPIYASIAWEAIYPGVDLSLQADRHELRYLFAVAPGVDPGAIFLGLPGARRVDLETPDTLVIEAATA